MAVYISYCTNTKPFISFIYETLLVDHIPALVYQIHVNDLVDFQAVLSW